MVRQHSGQRGERFDDSSNGGWLGDRGVSEVIGSILVFGLLVALLAIVQTQAVPNANEEVEAEHSIDVQGDLLDLKSSISKTARDDGSATTTVSTGMTYPPRLVLYNPPAVQGTLTTGESDSVFLNDFSAPETDTAQYIESPGPFETHSISYRVDYNRYSNAPVTRFEHGVMVDQYEDNTTIVESEGDLVSGNHISLVMLRGGLQESGVRPASVTTHPVSAPAQKVTIETPSSDRGELSVPTGISEEVWLTEILDDQIDSNAPADVSDCDDLDPSSYSPDTGDDRYIVGCSYQTSPNRVLTLQLQSDSTYVLRLSKVGFSGDSDRLTPTYVTDVTAPSTSGLVVEVRDKYNNPIERRVPLTLERSDGSTEPLMTGPDGRADIPDGLTDEADVYLRVGSNAASPPSSCDELGCAEVEPPGLPASSLVRVTDVAADQDANTVTYSFTNSGDRDTNISEVQLGYATQREERTLTVAVGQVSGCSSLELNCLSSEELTTSLVDDGPGAIDNITVQPAGTTYLPNASNGAQENLAPVRFDDNGQDPEGNTPQLEAGTMSDVEFALDDSIDLDGSNSVDVSITVYYSDGSVATYSRTLYNEAGDQGQSP
jgi:hypothetical protein